ncbi:rod shape-determining protein MreC [Povalibacter sp.]|uniref:rod shape-determining protein MreC n=1 Tax=Povalibacter sp. TaxID=1962978 RepID=UPI002F3FE2B9
MVTLSSDSRPIIGRGPPLGARFFVLAVASIALMVFDHRGGYMDVTRSWLHTAVNPLYAVVQLPGQLWDWMTGGFSDRGRLRTENTQLSEELRAARVKLLRFDALTEENRRLRAIRNASQGMGERTLIAEIMRVDLDPYRHRVRINKGSQDGVFKGQPVLDAFGIVGQVTRVDAIGAEVILISDDEHATPVQVNRNGIRSIAVGSGDINRLTLPFLTIESDVKPDDLLVSSGLDGIFPAGYPVAMITKVERDPSATFAVVEARPLAQLDRSREVLLLWVDPATLPVQPATPPTLAPAAIPSVESAASATTAPTTATPATTAPTTPPPP